jgi:hypothetical protein
MDAFSVSSASREHSRTVGRAIDAFAKAVKADPRDLRARYALAQEVERQAVETAMRNFSEPSRRSCRKIRDNLAALVDLCRIAGKRGDPAACKLPSRG